MSLTIFICKSCGRAIKSETKPNYCYADGTTSIENISDEDAKKMELFSMNLGVQLENFIVEFINDYRYHPFTGAQWQGAKLHQLQEQIMEKVNEG